MRAFMKKLFPCSLAAFVVVMLVTVLFSNECSAYVYWTNLSSDSIGRANLDGSSPNQNWITGCNNPIGVVVDTNYVYWTNSTSNSIGRANLDGSSPNQNWITGGNGPDGVTLDPPPVQPAIPTLGEWGMIILFLLMTGLGYITICRRTNASF